MVYPVSPVRIVDLKLFADALRAERVELPAPVVRALEIDELLADAEPSPIDILSATDEEILAHVDRQTVADALGERSKQMPVRRYFLDSTRDAAAIAAGRALAAGEVDTIIEALRPRFDQAGKVLRRAADLGLTARTTADDIIRSGSNELADAWREAQAAKTKIESVAHIRRKMSELLALSPTAADQPGYNSMTSAPYVGDWSVCFAAEENWSSDGHYCTGNRWGNGVDWLALAGGGLRLNTPSEVEAKMLARRRGEIRSDAVPKPS